MKHFAFILSLLLVISCVKDDPPKDENGSSGNGNGGFQDSTQVQQSPIKLIWQVPLAPGKELAHSDYPLLVGEDKIVFTTSLAATFNGMFVCDRRTGERLWTSENDEIIATSEYYKTSSGGDIFLSANKHVYKFDGENGNLEWSVSSRNGYDNLTQIGDYIYHVSEIGSGQAHVSYLLRTHKNSGKSETLFQLETAKNDGLEPSPLPPILWRNHNEDSILIFSCRNLDVGPIRNRLDLIAWNLSTRKLEWMNTEAGPKGLGTIHVPIIYDEKIFLKDSEHITCFDPESGRIIWQSGPMTGHSQTPLLFAENKLFVNPDGRDMYALDPDNGAIIWHKTGMEAPAAASHTLYYDGKLYSNGITDVVSKLHCIDPSTG